jgi:hypothetical protein
LQRSIWFNRLVLGLGVLLFARLGLSDIVGPLSAAAATHTTLGTPDAITAVRVQGSVFLCIAGILTYCVVSERRLVAGLGLFATVITGVAGVRFIGLILDGAGAFTLMVLKAEAVMAVASTCAVMLERQRNARHRAHIS